VFPDIKDIKDLFWSLLDSVSFISLKGEWMRVRLSPKAKTNTDFHHQTVHPEPEFPPDLAFY